MEIPLRAVDKEGNTVDYLLTSKRDKKAAKALYLQDHQEKSSSI